MNLTLPAERYSRPLSILDHKALRYNPCQDFIFPSIIKAKDTFANSLAGYYLYYAPHDAPGGICLAYSDSPEGPWVEYEANPIISNKWGDHYAVSHVSSPHALWMPSEGRLFLYFHGENNTTRLATSRDGIHFDYEGIAVSTSMYDDISESSYARVFPYAHPSNQASYVMLFMGNHQETRRIYAAWSRDGRTFTAQKKPLINPPSGSGVSQVGAPWLHRIEGKPVVLFHGDTMFPNFNDLTTDIFAAGVGDEFNQEEHLGIFYRRQEVSETNKRVSDPCLYEEGGQAWLLMSVGSRLRQTLAIAKRL